MNEPTTPPEAPVIEDDEPTVEVELPRLPTTQELYKAQEEESDG